jgi:hypothetical protein
MLILISLNNVSLAQPLITTSIKSLYSVLACARSTTVTVGVI